MAKKLNALNKAKKEKNDEFYTRLEYIEQELNHYMDHFKDKTVICNCDDPFESNFYKFFFMHMKSWNLKRLICTSYGTSPIAGGQMSLEHWIKKQTVPETRCAYVLDIKREDFTDDNDVFSYENSIAFAKEHAKRLKGDGDFRSDECLKYLDGADIVVTNPPFSIFKEYVTTIIKHDKKFLILGNPNAITYKEIFPLIQENKIWVGCKSMGTDMYFDIPKDYQERLLKENKEGSGYVRKNGEILGRAQAIWYTNLKHNKRDQEIILTNSYKKHPEMYPKYDNYDAIEVSSVADIPKDYDGIMGVPITFLDKYCPDQFEIKWIAAGHSKTSMPEDIKKEVKFDENMKSDIGTNGYGIINTKQKYHRILIKRINKERLEHLAQKNQ